MKPQVRALRHTDTQACQLRGFPFREFMADRGLEDILDEAEQQDWPAKEIAGQVLARCCLTDGKFNNFQVGFLTVITFLKDQLGSLGQGEQQAFADLAKLLKSPNAVQGIAGWLNTHYPAG